MAKYIIWLTKSEARKQKFASVSADGDGIIHIIKQMKQTKQDIITENCVWNDADKFTLTDKATIRAWYTHYTWLLNVMFEWPSSTLP